jgi:hypothetical protein
LGVVVGRLLSRLRRVAARPPVEALLGALLVTLLVDHPTTPRLAGTAAATHLAKFLQANASTANALSCSALDTALTKGE